MDGFHCQFYLQINQLSQSMYSAIKILLSLFKFMTFLWLRLLDNVWLRTDCLRGVMAGPMYK